VTEPADDVETRLRRALAERDALAARLAEAMDAEARRFRSARAKAPWFRDTFQSKHGTAERWDICDCEECVTAKPKG
jgi:hypothetical protein